MMSAAEASLRETSSPRTRSNSRTSSAMSWGKAINKVLLSELLHTVAFIDELVQQHACDHVQRFEYALALMRRGAESRHLQLAVIEQELHVFNRSGIGQIALVILDDIRDLIEVKVERLQVLLEVLEALHVL